MLIPYCILFVKILKRPEAKDTLVFGMLRAYSKFIRPTGTWRNMIFLRDHDIPALQQK